MRLLRDWALLSVAVFVLKDACHVLAKQPKVSKTQFDNLPRIFFYFDDSEVMMAHDVNALNVLRSADNGVTWKTVEDVPKGKAVFMIQNPHDRKRAYILGNAQDHWVTSDQGRTWKKFKLDGIPISPERLALPLSFNADEPEYVLFEAYHCDGKDAWGEDKCVPTTFVTTDGFDSNPKRITDRTLGCLWARGQKMFKEATKKTILCLSYGKTLYQEDRKMIKSDDFFKTESEPLMDGARPIHGLVGLAGVKKYLLAAVKSKGSDHMALYVSDDAETWAKAEFPQGHKGIAEKAYTLLESTDHSIQLDVADPGTDMGGLFTSNSNGSYFHSSILYTNRNEYGYVDFEQIQGIDGILLVNVVDNHEEVAKAAAERKDTKKLKKLVSKISFDDGKTWADLKGPDGKTLHLHSVTNQRNGGPIFSSPAPGIVMGIGSIGASLKPYDECNLYVSQDGGLNWIHAKENAHKYEFGDSGSILMAVYDEGPTSKFSYSLDYGHNWEDVDLEVKVRAKLLTTVPDSTSPVFSLFGTTTESKHYFFSIDFTPLENRKCKLEKDNKDGDFEKWYARLDKDGKPDCIMGHKQFYWRRNQKAKCFIEEVFKDPEVEVENCACTEEDYECDFNFIRDDNNKCVPAATLSPPKGECKDPKDKYKGPSGYRLIPGNTCKDGEKLDKPVDRDCTETVKKPSSGKLSTSIKEFNGDLVEVYYLKQADTSVNRDETVVMRTSKNDVFISHDHGVKWEQILKGENIIAIWPNRFKYDHVYFLTDTAKVFYSIDRGRKILSFKAPAPPHPDRIPLSFHPEESEWIIWVGQKDCDGGSKNDWQWPCHANAWYTKDREEFHVLSTRVRTCSWIRSDKLLVDKSKLVFCERWSEEGSPSKEGNNLQLVSSHDMFETQKVEYSRIAGFATMEEFIVVAEVEDDRSLKALASVDGETFAHAKFPPNFNPKEEQAFTVLDSLTHSVFMHVTTSGNAGAEFGALVKSNSNGTSYVMLLEAVNRNSQGYVDFETLQGLEGVALVNVVSNVDEVKKKGNKKIKSMITHNDGSDWVFITPPGKDVDGKSYSCGSDLKKCSLNLHSYTERRDPRDTFGSASAVGLMMGVGNVGESLSKREDGNTYLTTDAGITWKEVKKGPYLYEYGDQGSIIAIVNDRTTKTNKISYTLDEGKTWDEYPFADSNMIVEKITTVPSDTSRHFIIWARPETNAPITAYSIDFSGLTDKECKLDPKNKDEDDFYLWTPKHPLLDDGDKCLFGHEIQYHRKIVDHKCYIGKLIPQPHAVVRNCSCTRQDFECDYNFIRTNSGTCSLAPGLKALDPKDKCRQNPALATYWTVTGYRKIPASTCQGGMTLDEVKELDCPGHEGESRRGASGVGLFFAIVIPIVGAGVIGYVIWRRFEGKLLGQIRLGEDQQDQSPFLKYPILVIAGVVAIIAAIPTILQTLWNHASSRFVRSRRYTTRSSFARGSYASVGGDTYNDEGELLGVDSDDEEV